MSRFTAYDSRTECKSSSTSSLIQPSFKTQFTPMLVGIAFSVLPLYIFVYLASERQRPGRVRGALCLAADVREHRSCARASMTISPSHWSN